MMAEINQSRFLLSQIDAIQRHFLVPSRLLSGQKRYIFGVADNKSDITECPMQSWFNLNCGERLTFALDKCKVLESQLWAMKFGRHRGELQSYYFNHAPFP